MGIMLGENNISRRLRSRSSAGVTNMGMMRDDRVADMSMLEFYVPSHFHQLFRRDDGNKQLLVNHSWVISHFIVV